MGRRGRWRLLLLISACATATAVLLIVSVAIPRSCPSDPSRPPQTSSHSRKAAHRPPPTPPSRAHAFAAMHMPPKFVLVEKKLLSRLALLSLDVDRSLQPARLMRALLAKGTLSASSVPAADLTPSPAAASPPWEDLSAKATQVRTASDFEERVRDELSRNLRTVCVSNRVYGVTQLHEPCLGSDVFRGMKVVGRRSDRRNGFGALAMFREASMSRDGVPELYISFRGTENAMSAMADLALVALEGRWLSDDFSGAEREHVVEALARVAIDYAELGNGLSSSPSTDEWPPSGTSSRGGRAKSVERAGEGRPVHREHSSGQGLATGALPAALAGRISDVWKTPLLDDVISEYVETILLEQLRQAFDFASDVIARYKKQAERAASGRRWGQQVQRKQSSTSQNQPEGGIAGGSASMRKSGATGADVGAAEPPSAMGVDTGQVHAGVDDGISASGVSVAATSVENATSPVEEGTGPPSGEAKEMLHGAAHDLSPDAAADPSAAGQRTDSGSLSTVHSNDPPIVFPRISIGGHSLGGCFAQIVGYKILYDAFEESERASDQPSERPTWARVSVETFNAPGCMAAMLYAVDRAPDLFGKSMEIHPSYAAFRTQRSGRGVARVALESFGLLDAHLTEEESRGGGGGLERWYAFRTAIEASFVHYTNPADCVSKWGLHVCPTCLLEVAFDLPTVDGGVAPLEGKGKGKKGRGTTRPSNDKGRSDSFSTVASSPLSVGTVSSSVSNARSAREQVGRNSNQKEVDRWATVPKAASVESKASSRHGEGATGGDQDAGETAGDQVGSERPSEGKTDEGWGSWLRRKLPSGLPSLSGIRSFGSGIPYLSTLSGMLPSLPDLGGSGSVALGMVKEVVSQVLRSAYDGVAGDAGVVDRIVTVHTTDRFSIAARVGAELPPGALFPPQGVVALPSAGAAAGARSRLSLADVERAVDDLSTTSKFVQSTMSALRLDKLDRGSKLGRPKAVMRHPEGDVLQERPNK